MPDIRPPDARATGTNSETWHSIVHRARRRQLYRRMVTVFLASVVILSVFGASHFFPRSREATLTGQAPVAAPRQEAAPAQDAPAAVESTIARLRRELQAPSDVVSFRWVEVVRGDPYALLNTLLAVLPGEQARAGRKFLVEVDTAQPRSCPGCQGFADAVGRAHGLLVLESPQVFTPGSYSRAEPAELASFGEVHSVD